MKINKESGEVFEKKGIDRKRLVGMVVYNHKTRKINTVRSIFLGKISKSLTNLFQLQIHKLCYQSYLTSTKRIITLIGIKIKDKSDLVEIIKLLIWGSTQTLPMLTIH